MYSETLVVTPHSEEDVLDYCFECLPTKHYLWPGYGLLRTTRDGAIVHCAYRFERENVDFGKLNGRFSSAQEQYRALADSLNELVEKQFFPEGVEFHARHNALHYDLPRYELARSLSPDILEWHIRTALEHFGLDSFRGEALLDPLRYVENEDGTPFFTGPDFFPERALRRITPAEFAKSLEDQREELLGLDFTRTAPPWPTTGSSPFE